MNMYLIAAALLSIFVGLVHSALGEVLVFKNLRRRTVVPTLSAVPLQARNVRILWATWHIASIFGFAVAYILFHASTQPALEVYVINALALAMLSSGLLVMVATRGKHPGWVGLTSVAVLCWLGQ
ncbi:hypothetical protein [Alteromonas oceanisediminis]|uniref:hypothetical protein n=1 Tax=Alteromonas oceanisediminis TaxID=2836180 RepID=UPI001BD95426|nr:hypothetical protein [Alteromonas oceanisediminis]MBT0588043.1 hypothetical protein [Alteromonas oceanisediminis]